MKTITRTTALLATLTLAVANLHAFDLTAHADLGSERISLLSPVGASALAAIPTAAISAGETRFELGGSRRYRLAEFDQVWFAAAHRHQAFTIAAGFSQLGDPDFYAEQTAALSAAARFRSITCGAVGSVRYLRFGAGYPSLSASTFGVSVAIRSRRIAVGLQADNLTEPRFDPGAEPSNDTYTLRVELAGPGRYVIGGRLTLEQRERPRFGLTHQLDLNRQASLFWSIATAPLTLAGGFDIMYSGSRLSYSASYHPTLGLSHLFSIGWTFGGKRP